MAWPGGEGVVRGFVIWEWREGGNGDEEGEGVKLTWTRI